MSDEPVGEGWRMKRKRALLYEVFGARDTFEAPPQPASPATRTEVPARRSRAKREPERRSKSPPSAPRPRPSSTQGQESEVRLSYELATAIVIVAVVFIGTSYYFGTLRGKATAEMAQLSLRSRSSEAPPSSAPRPEDASPVMPAGLHAVKIATYKYGDSDYEGRAKLALDVKEELQQKGFPKVEVLCDESRRELYIFIGEAANSRDPELIRIRDRVKTTTSRYDPRNSKPFGDAVIQKLPPLSE